MRAAILLSLAVGLFTPPQSQSPQSGPSERRGGSMLLRNARVQQPGAFAGAVLEDEYGTLPVWEVTNYLIVQDAPELHGFRVHHRVSRSLIGTYEFVDLRSLMQSRPPVAPGRVFSGTWSSGETIPAGVVFAQGFWLDQETSEGCTSAPCSEPNNLCHGWCSGSVWVCVCTAFKSMENSKSAARRHFERVGAAQEVWPPN